MRAEQLILVSAIGAAERSPFFYNRVKGELESAIRFLNIPHCSVLQPSLLLGKRDDFRLLEEAGKRLTTLLKGSLSRFSGINASDVAKAMIVLAKKKRSGFHLYRSEQIKSLAHQG